MKHLFIINPVAKKIRGKTDRIKEKIAAFFAEHPNIKHDVYESAWCRDSVTFIRRYISETAQTVRVHALGGTGTLFEVVNSVVGLDNAEIASYPYGRANAFIKYFGRQNEELFLSISSQVFDKAVPVDVLRCGKNYGMCYGIAGVEAQADALGRRMPSDISYVLAGSYLVLSGKSRCNYFIEIDGNRIDGAYISVMVANTPCYGDNMHPAVDARPTDGLLDIYLFKNAPKLKLLSGIPVYTRGDYRKLPDLISHYTAKKVTLSSDDVMCMSVDGELFYGTSTEYEIIPNAVKFVCPSAIELSKLPRIYGRRGGNNG